MSKTSSKSKQWSRYCYYTFQKLVWKYFNYEIILYYNIFRMQIKTECIPNLWGWGNPQNLFMLSLALFALWKYCEWLNGVWLIVSAFIHTNKDGSMLTHFLFLVRFWAYATKLLISDSLHRTELNPWSLMTEKFPNYIFHVIQRPVIPCFMEAWFILHIATVAMRIRMYALITKCSRA